MERPVLRLKRRAEPRKSEPATRVHMFIALTILSIWVLPSRGLARDTVPDLSGEYQFLAPEDTLAILEEEG